MLTRIALAVVMSAVVGCTTTKPVVTPARVESVVALGTYMGARQLINQGNSRDAQAALIALQVIEASGERDMVTIGAALSKAGLNWIDTPEGQLAFGVAVSVFGDRYGPEVILNDRWADAVLKGAVRGINLAFAKARAGPPVNLLAVLEAEAAATRPP